MAPRRYTVDEVAPPLVETWHVIRAWLGGLSAEDFAASSAVDGWSVADLTAHLGLAMGALISAEPVAASSTEPAMSIEEWTRIYPKVAVGIDRATKQRAAATADDLLGALDEQWSLAARSIEDRGSADVTVHVRMQRSRWSDLLVSRLLELVVHGDDLARSFPGRQGPEIPAPAQRIAVRTLLDVLATRAPGRSVEIRVPPFAAVQCVEGPRHTRGTPANVIETDPSTWIRLASGRLTWTDAVTAGRVSASGSRADLGGLLPLL